MKLSLPHIPSGASKAVNITHAKLASFFTQMARMHSQMANAPDKAVSNLPRPDKAAVNSRSAAGYQGRMPVIGDLK